MFRKSKSLQSLYLMFFCIFGWAIKASTSPLEISLQDRASQQRFFFFLFFRLTLGLRRFLEKVWETDVRRPQFRSSPLPLYERTCCVARYKHDRVRPHRVLATKNATFLRQKGFLFLVKDFRKVQMLQLLGKRVFLHPPLIVLGTITTHVWREKKWDGNNRRFPVWKIREREVRLGIRLCRCSEKKTPKFRPPTFFLVCAFWTGVKSIPTTAGFWFQTRQKWCLKSVH